MLECLLLNHIFSHKISTFNGLTELKCNVFIKNFFKEFNGDQKYIRCPDLRDNNFEVMHSAITFYKVDLTCAETVKYKPTGNDSGFITYSNKTHFLVYGWITVSIL